MTAEKSNLCELASDVINQTKKLGATAAEVDISASSGFSINVRKSKLETIEYNNSKSLVVTAYFNYCTGTAITSDLKPQAISAAIKKACYIAKFTSSDSCVGLADQELMTCDYQEINSKLNLYHPWQIKAEDAIELAKNAEETGFSYDKRLINSDGFSLDTSKTLSVYANSHGFCGVTNTTKHDLGCSFIAQSKKEMQRDYYYTVARDALDLENANQVALRAAKRTVDRLGARKIITQVTPVIFIAEIASSLFSNFIHAIYGSNIYRNSSFLLNHLNKPVLSSHINIEENPHIPKALGSAAFDDEGVKLFHNNIVVDGILQHYILDSYAARKLKTVTTGNAGGIHNLIIKHNNINLDSLLRKMGTGLLITELMGDGVNIITGDYSRGAFGYWIENGTIQYPVTGVTIAGNLKNMLLNIVAISNDVDYRSNILTGSVLLDRMTVAGSMGR